MTELPTEAIRCCICEVRPLSDSHAKYSAAANEQLQALLDEIERLQHENDVIRCADITDDPHGIFWEGDKQ